MSDLKEIDRIRKVDVPWKFYLFVFTVCMAGSIIACYFGLSYLRVKRETLIPICVFFILGMALGLAFITFLGMQQEEVSDSYKMATLHNKISHEQKLRLNLQRMNLQLIQLNTGRDKVEQDKCYLLTLNQLRGLSSQLMSGSQIAPKDINDHMTNIFVRLQEIVTKNAKFTNRLIFEMADQTTMDRAFTDADKLAIIRETFSVHIILAYFCSEERFDYTRLGLIARDNL